MCLGGLFGIVYFLYFPVKWGNSQFMQWMPLSLLAVGLGILLLLSSFIAGLICGSIDSRRQKVENICRVLVILVSVYFWIFIPIAELIYSNIWSRQVAATYAIQLKSLGLVDVLLSDEINSVPVVPYDLEILSPLIAFSAMLLFMLWLRPAAKSVKQYVIYVVIICAAVINAVLQGYAGCGVSLCLAAVSGMVLALLWTNRIAHI